MLQTVRLTNQSGQASWRSVAGYPGNRQLEELPDSHPLLRSTGRLPHETASEGAQVSWVTTTATESTSGESVRKGENVRTETVALRKQGGLRVR